MNPPIERRKEPRQPFHQPVQFWHRGLSRTVTALGRDISPSGASLRLPLSIPITPGQQLHLRFLPAARADQAPPPPPQPLRMARVCRVSRLQTILEAEQIVGLQMLE